MIAADLIASFFGTSVATDAVESDVSVPSASTQLIAANARRIALSVTNNGLTQLTITRFGPASSTLARVIAPGDTYDFWWYNELDQITRAFIANSLASTVSVHLREVVLIGSDDSN